MREYLERRKGLDHVYPLCCGRCSDGSSEPGRRLWKSGAYSYAGATNGYAGAAHGDILATDGYARSTSSHGCATHRYARSAHGDGCAADCYRDAISHRYASAADGDADAN
jgi:hypothetical protein